MSQPLARVLTLATAVLFLFFLAAPGLAEDLPAGVSADWWGEVQRSIQQEEYGVVSDDHGDEALRAANPAHGFEARFDAAGLRLTPLDGASWEWGLTLTGWGRAEKQIHSAVLGLRAEGGRVELDRGLLTEWFVNSPEGLEHGFTVPVRPTGEGDALVLDVAFTGGLRAVFAEDGQAIDLYSAGNVSVLHYGKLLVTDATGAEVPARMEPIPGGVRIGVDDAFAVYPLTVDPLATSASWTAAGEGTGNSFAYSVATAGDVNGDGYSDLLVGAYGNASSTGKTYLYLGSASGPSAVASWTAVGESAGSKFGFSVATAGDVNGDGFSDAVVGASGWSTDTGRAYLYLGSASGLSATASWTASGEAAGSRFGFSVATAGDFNGDGRSDVLVGADGFSGNTGKAYLYAGAASGLSATASWTAVGEGSIDYFGASVATAGDVDGDGYSDVLVGAYGYSAGAGRAYLYRGGASGLTATASWTATGTVAVGAFGYSVGTAGDVNGDGHSDVVVGEYGNNSATGKAYVFLGGVGGLSATASWTATGDFPNNRFGWSVGTAGDVNGDGYSDLLVGAYGSNSSTGKAYMYLGGPSGPSATASWTAVGQSTNSSFAGSVATGGDVNGDGYSDVLIGASQYLTSTGKAYLYRGGPNGLSAGSSWTAVGERTNSYFAGSVATAGDVNGDGYSDVVVGADRNALYAGKAYLYLGGANGLSTAPSWTAVGEASGHNFGISVASAGDLNGDGYPDVVVGAHRYSSGAGKAYVYAGGPGGLSIAPTWSVVGEAGSSLGYAVASAGDVNRDGYADLLVGAFTGSSNRGRALMYLGGPGGLPATASWTAVGEASADRFGSAVASAGDVNGDGYSDVLIGALYWDGDPMGIYFIGKAYLYLGGASGLSATPSWTAVGENRDHYFAASVATAGDVNGDGYSDVITGARGYSNGIGKAYLYLGGPAGLPATVSWTKVGGSGTNQFGQAVSTAGDVNGDGYSDVLIGSGYSNLTGKAYMYLGGASGLPATPSWTTTGEFPANTSFGYAVATAGDVNGDGYADVVIADPEFNYSAGKTYLYLGGSERGGRSVSPSQYRADLSAPVSLGGAAYEQQFRIGLTPQSPAGRVGSKLQWQVTPWAGSSPFVTTPVESEATWDDGSEERTAEVSLAENLQRYVWRARIRYSPAESPFVPWSPWSTMTGNGLRETDVLSKSDPAPAPCAVPDQEVYISAVALDASRKPVMTFQDPNPSARVTGYNVYRSVAPTGPWASIGANVVDADPVAPDVQFVDPTGDTGSPWYYLIAPYNGACWGEGPW